MKCWIKVLKQSVMTLTIELHRYWWRNCLWICLNLNQYIFLQFIAGLLQIFSDLLLSSECYQTVLWFSCIHQWFFQIDSSLKPLDLTFFSLDSNIKWKWRFFFHFVCTLVLFKSVCKCTKMSFFKVDFLFPNLCHLR